MTPSSYVATVASVNVRYAANDARRLSISAVEYADEASAQRAVDGLMRVNDVLAATIEAPDGKVIFDWSAT